MFGDVFKKALTFGEVWRQKSASGMGPNFVIVSRFYLTLPSS